MRFVMSHTIKKWAGGAAGLGTAVTLIIAYVDAKTSALEKSLEEKNRSVYSYIDTKHSEVNTSLGQMMKVLDRIDDRVYKLNQSIRNR